MNDITNAKIGKNLRIIRLSHDLTLAEMGQLLGVSLQQVSKYERGVNSLSLIHLFRLVVEFEMDPYAIFDTCFLFDIHEKRKRKIISKLMKLPASEKQRISDIENILR